MEDVQVRFTKVIHLEPYEDEGGHWRPLRIEYLCPCCNWPTYILFNDKYDEGVPENLAKGLVPPDILRGEVRPCDACEHALSAVN